MPVLVRVRDLAHYTQLELRAIIRDGEGHDRPRAYRRKARSQQARPATPLTVHDLIKLEEASHDDA